MQQSLPILSLSLVRGGSLNKWVTSGNTASNKEGRLFFILVLLIAIFQKQLGILRWNISWQRAAVVKTRVGQFYRVLLVCLDPSQIVVSVTMYQYCIDCGDMESIIVRQPSYWCMVIARGFHNHTNFTVQLFEQLCQSAQFTSGVLCFKRCV